MSYTTTLYSQLSLSKAASAEVIDAVNSLFNNGGESPHFAECAPSRWCPWQISGDGDTLTTVDGVDDMNNNDYYLEWLAYIIKHYLLPNSIKLDGYAEWHGEDFINDSGQISFKDNIPTYFRWKLTNEEDDLRPWDVDYLTDGKYVKRALPQCLKFLATAK